MFYFFAAGFSIATSHVANTGRTVRIGAGFEIVQGDVSKATDKGTALMTEFGIAAA